MLYFRQEFIGQDGNIGFLQAGGVEDVDDFVGWGQI